MGWPTILLNMELIRWKGFLVSFDFVFFFRGLGSFVFFIVGLSCVWCVL